MSAGDTIFNSTDGTLYVYNGTDWKPMSSPTYTHNISYLVLAGGGSGADGQPDHGAGGGGGAGGYRLSYGTDSSGGGASSETALAIDLNTLYTVTVGGGGASVDNCDNAAGAGNKGLVTQCLEQLLQKVVVEALTGIILVVQWTRWWFWWWCWLE